MILQMVKGVVGMEAQESNLPKELNVIISDLINEIRTEVMDCVEESQYEEYLAEELDKVFNSYTCGLKT